MCLSRDTSHRCDLTPRSTLGRLPVVKDVQDFMRQVSDESLQSNKSYRPAAARISQSSASEPEWLGWWLEFFHSLSSYQYLPQRHRSMTQKTRSLYQDPLWRDGSHAEHMQISISHSADLLASLQRQLPRANLTEHANSRASSPAHLRRSDPSSTDTQCGVAQEAG